MTTITLSRPRVALNLLSIPHKAVAAIFGNVGSSIANVWREIVAELRHDAPIAIRYVLTGMTHNTAFADRAAEAVDSFTSRISRAGNAFSAWYFVHVMPRLFALFVILFAPILALAVAFVILKDEDFFGGFVDMLVGASKSVVTGKALL